MRYIILSLLCLLASPVMAQPKVDNEPCVQREPQKPYERPPNVFRMTPEEQKRDIENMMKYPPPGTVRPDGTTVKATRWCPEPGEVEEDPYQPLKPGVLTPGGLGPVDRKKEIEEGRAIVKQSFVMTPNDIEKNAKIMDKNYEDYEATLPECVPNKKIKRGEVCIEKAYREKLKAERKARGS